MANHDTNHDRAMFDLYYNDFALLAPGGRIVPAWSPDGKWLAFVDGPPDERHGRLVDLTDGTMTELVDLPVVRDGIRAATGETPSGRGLPFSELAFADSRTIVTEVGQHAVSIDLETMLVQRLIEPASTRCTPRQYEHSSALGITLTTPETASPDGRFLASTRSGNLVLRSTYDGREEWLTTDGTPEHEWRFDAHEPAFGKLFSNAGTVTNWSPDGTRLAAYRVDNRNVTRSPRVHYLKRDVDVAYRYLPKAGGVLERHTLCLVDVYGKPGARIQLDLGDTTDTYPVFAGWLPDGSQILVVRMSRDCRRLDVLAADAETGKVRELFSEAGDTFVRLHHDVYMFRRLGLWLTPDGKHILWLSERDGWRHLYSYNLRGELVRQLTTGAWPVDAVQRVVNGFVYFTARHDEARPYDLHLCRVPLDGGDVIRLTSGEGTHDIHLSPDAEVFVDTCSTPARPPASVLRRSDGALLCDKLSSADPSRLDELGWTSPQQFTVTAADGGTQLWGTMFFPTHFDPNCRYPLVEWVYGGPQVAMNPHDWLGDGYHCQRARALAQRGYVAVMLDARGTPGRSKAFHDVVHHNWAQALVEDHATAIEQLTARHQFIDRDRVAVIGHSWGGYAAFRLLADRPDVYKAGVASAPGLDPYFSVLYECYLGLPQQNRQAYDDANALTLAPRLKRPLMIACGTSDHSTWTDAIRMSDALIRAGKQHELVVLPEQPHAYDGHYDAYFWRKVFDFLTTTFAQI